MKLEPLGERVVLKKSAAEKESTTKSGIILAQGEVVAVGPGGMIDGHEVKMSVKAGDNVIYSKYAGTEVKFEDEEYIIVRQSDILAVIK